MSLKKTKIVKVEFRVSSQIVQDLIAMQILTFEHQSQGSAEAIRSIHFAFFQQCHFQGKETGNKAKIKEGVFDGKLI